MNKEQLVAATAQRMKKSKSEHVYAKWVIAAILPHILDAISESLADGEEVQLQGFGRFGIKTIKARNAINPQTKEHVWVPEKKKVIFHQTRLFKFNDTEGAETECTLTDSDTTQQDE